SIVGGTTRLIEPVCKFAVQAGSPYTVFESIVRAGELAQRDPKGPAYISVSTETLMDDWTPPKHDRAIPAAPRKLTAQEDIDRLAELLVKAKNPVVLTEAAGREVESFEALVELCELLALPVVETNGALFANFPKSHPMHQGNDLKPFREDADLVVVIRARAPWYPPSDCPPNAVIAIIDEAPHRETMVYQSLQADMYLEGDCARTLRDLTAAARSRKLDTALIEARRQRLVAAHEKLWSQKRARQEEARTKTPIDPVWLCAALNKALPPETIYIDEVTTHTGLLRQHIVWDRPQSLFTRQGGLGQGLGLSLGIKLARPDQPVVTLIGDGAFLYNPVLGCLGAARDYGIPTMTVIFNNRKYAAMQGMHLKMYPKGTAVDTDTYHGTHINAPDFVMVAESIGGYGELVDDPAKLEDALRRGLQATREGRPAVIDVRLA
ncbi:MAG: hypothetical protein KDJ29_15220, partial [Hyphomicrobiales bacterium]|nr:hypothetical protein [Hyphomicrobiales bacterium]